MTTDPERESVSAPLTQVATGLPVARESCPVCERRLREGTPVTVQLSLTDDRWTIDACHCRKCPHPPAKTAKPSRLLDGTLTMYSHAHTQTHRLCLTDVEPFADQTAVKW